MRNSIIFAWRKTLAAVLAFSFLVPALSEMSAVKGAKSAVDDAPPFPTDRIIVSMGDSYSSGEGLWDYYDQDKPFEVKLESSDWRGHRSKNSWPGQLKLKGVSKTMKEHRDTNWFFVASSGAKVCDIYGMQGEDYYSSAFDLFSDHRDQAPQINVFNDKALEDKTVDYVTMTMGGNDVGFVPIVKEAALSIGEPNALRDKLETAWNHFNNPYVDEKGEPKQPIRKDLIDAYKSIYRASGKEAQIIIAGYPQLFYEGGSDVMINEKEAVLIDGYCSLFNEGILSAVNKAREEGIPVHFVSVESGFKGHGAYAPIPYINKIMLSGDKSQDRKPRDFAAQASMHPNADGARIYADRVNAAIEYLDNKRTIAWNQEAEQERQTKQNPTRSASRNKYEDFFYNTVVPILEYNEPENQFQYSGPICYELAGFNGGWVTYLWAGDLAEKDAWDTYAGVSQSKQSLKDAFFMTPKDEALAQEIESSPYNARGKEWRVVHVSELRSGIQKLLSNPIYFDADNTNDYGQKCIDGQSFISETGYLCCYDYYHNGSGKNTRYVYKVTQVEEREGFAILQVIELEFGKSAQGEGNGENHFSYNKANEELHSPDGDVTKSVRYDCLANPDNLDHPGMVDRLLSESGTQLSKVRPVYVVLCDTPDGVHMESATLDFLSTDVAAPALWSYLAPFEGEYEFEKETETLYSGAIVRVLKQFNYHAGFDQIDFEIAADSGPSREMVNIGYVEGTAIKVSENNYRFQETIIGIDAVIDFRFDPDKGTLTVKESYTDGMNPYAGWGVSFAHEYKKR